MGLVKRTVGCTSNVPARPRPVHPADSSRGFIITVVSKQPAQLHIDSLLLLQDQFLILAHGPKLVLEELLNLLHLQ